MVNSKKMNKSTVAVIVLALLLVLSLILTATGAWFTDKAVSDKTDASINWGAIKVQYTAEEGNNGIWTDKTGATTVDSVLPGDKLDFAGSIAFAGSDSDLYMLVKISDVSVDDALKTYLKVTSITIKDGETELTEVADVTAAAGYKFYKIAKADLAKTLTVAGGISVADETPNIVGETQLNGGAKITLEYGIEIGVIQARNIEAQAAYDALKAGVPAYNAAA